MAMLDFIRRKNIANLTKQLAGGQLDEAQRRYAEQKLAEELAEERAAADVVPLPPDGDGGGHAASC
ncbi:hypothetical protein [Reyranella sp.]|jgi:hypothetical protein|uniref:hypothetical protein n=1 Tax=Reyranella sp. TaxID=1929291 RepID=UPI004036AB36